MSEERKHLYRSRSDRMLAGVCGGLGVYYGVDPTVIRLLFVFFALFVGFSVLLYIILLFIIPLEPEAGEALEEVPADEGE